MDHRERQFSPFVVRPHAKHFDYLVLSENLVHETVVDVDASGTGPLEVTDQPFKARRSLIRVLS